MNIETTTKELKNCTDKQLKELARAISTEQQIRKETKRKEIIEEACTILEKLDGELGRAINVTVSSYSGKFSGELDLLELCEALRDIIS